MIQVKFHLNMINLLNNLLKNSNKKPYTKKPYIIKRKILIFLNRNINKERINIKRYNKVYHK